MPAESLSERLARRIGQTGPMAVSAYVAAALYDPDFGFYTAGGGQAGRRGDFLTSPEVGPLFGAVIAEAVDLWWNEAGRPAVFVVEEWVAGPGTLARAVVAAAPAVLEAGALRWVQVEVSPGQRAAHLDHPALRSVDPDDTSDRVDVVLANELLDNLPFDMAERGESGWHELRVGGPDAAGRFALVPGAMITPPSDGDALAVGSRIPVVTAAATWVASAVERATGRLVLLDYGATTAELAGRGDGWLRTHVAHHAVADWLVAPGSCDVTTDVPFDQLPGAPTMIPQAEWLRAHGIDALVEAGQAAWEAGAAKGGLAALTGRSRVREAEALLDPDGLGGFTVLEWTA